MKAIVQDGYGSADVLELRDIDVPEPAEGEVLVRVHAAGVDPSVWHLMTGLPYMVRLMGLGVRAPKQPVRGWDFAGHVESIGPGVAQFGPGDKVYGTCNGSFAEHACAEAGKIAPKPTSLTFEQAAAVPISGQTALQGLRDRGKVRAGQRVAVVGAGGGVGTFAVQIAKALGAEVTGVCSTTKVDLVRSLGADDVVDYTREDFADGRRRFDVILDTAGRRSLKHLRRALAPEGKAVIVGGEGGGRLTGGFERAIVGQLTSAFRGQKVYNLVAKETAQDLAVLTELIEAGKVTPVIDKTYALAEAPDAVRALAEGHSRGKSVVTVISGP